MTKALRVSDYLGHILKAIERIDRYGEEPKSRHLPDQSKRPFLLLQKRPL